jgi:predicted amidohydrolase
MGDVEANVSEVVRAIAKDKAHIVAFPEMFLTGYAVGDDVQRLALRLDDERLEPIRKAAAEHQTHVVVGGPRKARPGVTHNSAFLIAPDGTTQAYDKRCLATFTTFQEGLFFKPGNSSPVWETDVGDIGVGICYDLFFPELGRQQVLEGADLLLNISASPSTSQRFFEALFPARAIENAAFVAYTNLVGPQDGVVFWGGAQAWGPRGTLLGRLDAMKPGTLKVDLDWADLVPAREFRPTLRDGGQHPSLRMNPEGILSSSRGASLGSDTNPLPPRNPNRRMRRK